MPSPALAEAREETNRLERRFASIREKHREGIRRAVGGAISTLTGVGLGYYAKKYPEANEKGVLGFPLSLIVGGTGLACGMTNLGGQETAGYLMDMGYGAMAIWGYEQGAKLAEKHEEQQTG